MKDGIWRAAGVAALGLSAVAADRAEACEACFRVGNGDTYPEYDAFRTTSRWSSTYTSGSGLQQGQPTTLTWSIVPDGTTVLASGNGNSSAAPSVLVARYDAQFGINTASAGTSAAQIAQRTWFPIFSQSFERWSQISGLTYIYVADDGASMSTINSPSANRGDIRISSVTISGAGGVLAYNYYPSSGGDMVLDAADITDTRMASTANNMRYGRNVVMHEHGHGMGIMHFESNNSAGLMEPFLSTSFDGPQFDDILSAQRLYGDALEKSGGNDSAATAFNLGIMSHGQTRSRGTHANTASVSSTQTDFISIDDETDKDYFKFTLAHNSKLSVTLTPKGPTYYEGPQVDPDSQSSFNASALSDLVLTLYNTNGTSVITTLNATSLGGTESFANLDLLAGTYFVAVTGTTSDKIQMYRLDVVASVPEPGSVGLLVIAGAGLLLRRRRPL